MKYTFERLIELTNNNKNYFTNTTDIILFENEDSNVESQILKARGDKNDYDVLIKPITDKQKEKFLQKYWVGSETSNIKLGAFVGGKMVGVLTLLNNNLYKTNTFVALINEDLLLNSFIDYFVLEFNPSNLLLSLDNRFYNIENGIIESPQPYYYNGDVFSTKSMLKNTLFQYHKDFKKTMSPVEFAKQKGYRVFFDAGKIQKMFEYKGDSELHYLPIKIENEFINKYKSGISIRHISKTHGVDHRVVKKILLNHNISIDSDRKKIYIPDDKEESKIINAYVKDKKTIRKICKDLNKDKRRVNEILDRHGIRRERTPFSKEQESEIISLYQQNNTQDEIAFLFRTSAKKIRDCLIGHNIPINHRLELYTPTEEEEFDICEQYNAGDNIIDIRHKYKTSIYKITNILKKHNIEIRKFISLQENQVYDFLLELGLNVERNNWSILENKEIDFYLPDFKIGIEYNGLYWHREGLVEDKKIKDRLYHLNKTIKCNEKGIRLIHIYEDDWINNNKLVKERLRYLFGKSNGIKIGARTTEIKQIEPKIGREFLEKYHLQGKENASVYYGAFYGSELVAVMSFLLKKEWHLNRFSNNYHYICSGIASRLLKQFIQDYNPIEIHTYSDRGWTNFYEGSLYEKLGFQFEGYTQPGYYWMNLNNKWLFRENRQKYQKKKLKKLFPDLYIDNLSESQIMTLANYDRIWNCGNIKYCLKWVK